MLVHMGLCSRRHKTLAGASPRPTLLFLPFIFYLLPVMPGGGKPPPYIRLLRKLALVILSEAKNLDFKTLRFAQLTMKKSISEEVYFCFYIGDSRKKR